MFSINAAILALAFELRDLVKKEEKTCRIIQQKPFQLISCACKNGFVWKNVVLVGWFVGANERENKVATDS